MGKLKSKRKLVKILGSIALSLLMTMGMMSTTIVNVNALTMTEVLDGKKVTFYVNESINVFDALKAADTRLGHLDTGCFTNLTLNFSTSGRDYYSISGKLVTGIKSGTTTILISGVANCGAYDIHETFNNTPITIEIKKRDGTKPTGFIVNDSTKNGKEGSITGLNPLIVYEYKNVDNIGSAYIKIPAGTTSINLPKGHYNLRVAETDTTNASKAESITIKEPAQTPDIPTVTQRTDTAIKIAGKTGEVYSIDGGQTWVNNPVFQNLTADTEYTVLAKKLGVENEYTTDSETSRLVVKTKASTNSVAQAMEPEVLSYNDTTIKIKANADEEYSIDGGLTWNKTGEFKNLSPNQSYNVVARKAETDSAMAGPVSNAKTIKTKISSNDVPAPVNTPVLKATDQSVEVMNPDSKNEYSIDNGKTWIKPKNNQVIFTGLEEGKKYSVLARTAETDTAMPSTATKANDITTLCHLIGNISAKNYPVSMKILDSKTGEVIQEIETDNQGNYSTLLPKGDYKIVADSNGESLITDIQLEPNDTDKNLVLQQGALISGTVYDDEGNPIANAKVVIETPKGNIELTTDQQGNYYTDAIEDGKYQSYIYTTQGIPQSTATTVEVKQGQMTTASGTELKPGLITKGEIVADTNGDGKLDPIQNGKVELIDKNGKIFETTTDANGSYILPSVAPGTYQLKVTDSKTGAVIERTIQIGNDNSTALGTTPEKIDGTVEINAEKFIQNNLTDANQNVITKPTGENYKIILDAQKAWNALTKLEKDETNKILVNKYNGLTYPELLKQAESIQTQVQNFIKDHMSLNDQTITEVNKDTYATIISAKDAWDKLSEDEKQAANDTLKVADATQTYEEMYAQAAAIKEAGNQFIKDYMTLNGQTITEVNKDTYATILSAKDAWDKLTEEEKQAANDALKVAGATQTYEQMLAATKAKVNQSAINFINKYVSDKNKNIYKEANKSNYMQILSGSDVWSKLSESEKDAINAILIHAGSKNYEDLLKQANVVKKSVQTNDNTNIVPLYALLAVSLLLGSYIIGKRKKEND